MIFKRAIANLRAQNWMAISIEVVIVIVGVFIGTQVSNWNAERLEKRETQRMLSQLKPSLQLLDDFSEGARAYYRDRPGNTRPRRLPDGKATGMSATANSSPLLTRQAKFPASAPIVRL